MGKTLLFLFLFLFVKEEKNVATRVAEDERETKG